MRKQKKPNINNSDPLAEKTAEKQLEKLSLEIEQMKNKSKWHDRVALCISLLTVIIAVGGFVFGIVQFQNQQDKNRLELEKQRNDEIQIRYENSVEKLLQFNKDEKISVATAGNLLINLKTQIEEKASIKQNGIEPTPKQIAEKEQQITRKVTLRLVQSIEADFNLENFRDLDFILAVISNWNDFSTYLVENPDEIEVIIGHLTNALEKIYNMDSSIIKEITYDNEEQLFNYPNGYGKIGYKEINHFQNLVINYKYLYSLTISDEKRRERALVKFQAATCNQQLTQQILEENLEWGEQEEFNHCPEE